MAIETPQTRDVWRRLTSNPNFKLDNAAIANMEEWSDSEWRRVGLALESFANSLDTHSRRWKRETIGTNRPRYSVLYQVVRGRAEVKDVDYIHD